MLQVVNVSRLRTRDGRATVVYVGRRCAGWLTHALANPFKLDRGVGARAECLAKYREWLAARVTLESDLAALWEQTGHGQRALGCWCVDARIGDGQPVVCHAQVLGEMLLDRFASVEVGK